jgi:hypothetical protein
MYDLTSTNQKNQYEIYKDFLDEKSLYKTTNKLQFTNLRVRSVYRSLMTNLSYLFAYKSRKDFSIRNIQIL